MTEYKTISYRLPENDLALLPEIGSMIDWAGSDYRCEEVLAEEKSDNICIAKVRAVNIAIAPEGRIQSNLCGILVPV